MRRSPAAQLIDQPRTGRRVTGRCVTGRRGTRRRVTGRRVAETLAAAVLAVLFNLVASTPAQADGVPGEEQHYIVRGLGLKLGDLYVSLDRDTARYSTRTRFATSGALSNLAHVHFSMSAAGRMDGRRAGPRSYVENVNTGKRISDVRMSYAAGLARVVSGRLGRDGAPINPLTQRDTIDPASAMLLAVGPMPRADLCDLDQPVFDGARRTRLELNAAVETEDGLLCRGRFLREAGYSKRQLARSPGFDLELTYVRRRDGQYVLFRGKVDTVFAPVVLEWADARSGP